MNLISLYYFLRVCQVGNFSQAAQLLFVSPQGVSKSIKTLEAELGCQLFRRTSQGLKLTEHGRLLEQRAKTIVHEMRQLQEEYRRLEEGATRKLRIGVTMGASQLLGHHFQRTLEEALPFLDLDLQDSWDLDCEEGVRTGTYDLAITSGPLDLTGLEARVLADSTIRAMVPKSHPLSHKERLRVDDLKDVPLLLTSSHFRLHGQIVEKCRGRGFEPTISGTAILLEATFLGEEDPGVICLGIDAFITHRVPTSYRLIPFSRKELLWQLVVIAKREGTMDAQLAGIQDVVWKSLRLTGKANEVSLL